MAADDELEVDEVMEEDEAHVRYEIASYPSDLTLTSIAEMWERKDIVIPDFQRSFVWNIRQSSLLIESFLIGLPVPQIFFYIDADNRSLVIDGQQRLMSVVFFFEGYFGNENTQGRRTVFRLQGLDTESPYHNKRFIDLDDADQRKLRGAVLRAINIRQLNPAGENSSIYHIFERLNTGGTPLKPQEIRNCVFRGELIGILRELNKDKNWRKILGKATFDKHQKDMELVLRVFALLGNVDVYEKPMKDYLSRVMAAEKDGKSARVTSFQKAFPQVAEIIATQLGAKPFHVRGPLNTAALDSVFCTLMLNLKKIPDNLKERYTKLKEDETFKSDTFYSTSDVVVVKRRFELAQQYLIGK
ncbi:DUF262 domain-containing protein [Ferrovibrio sp.]|uniref:DUF262 domain-containing protein n=1 Tax=Ferrovibrio sp. TaxID=1917215 RepID=UPI0035AEAF9A